MHLPKVADDGLQRTIEHLGFGENGKRASVEIRCQSQQTVLRHLHATAIDEDVAFPGFDDGCEFAAYRLTFLSPDFYPDTL